MAKKDKATAPAKETAAAEQVTIVTIKELVAEYEMDARKVRAIIRSLGHNAPKIEGAEGFGPKAKYEWKSNSAELAAIRKALTEAKNKPAAEAKPAKAEKATAPATPAAPAADDEDDEDDDE